MIKHGNEFASWQLAVPLLTGIVQPVYAIPRKFLYYTYVTHKFPECYLLLLVAATLQGILLKKKRPKAIISALGRFST
ncbi:hypothetical protein [Paenibacillus luteus]|uniref:hypothetical protein n=1 Tax=Paenibacillus luteus TaxID=2545753 RepID=UPI0019D69FD8|nr:hypothetical protein [Paenibacillus luteus]